MMSGIIAISGGNFRAPMTSAVSIEKAAFSFISESFIE
jgi:hypothetical protein